VKAGNNAVEKITNCLITREGKKFGIIIVPPASGRINGSLLLTSYNTAAYLYSPISVEVYAFMAGDHTLVSIG
jgi:hypothetical protein